MNDTAKTILIADDDHFIVRAFKAGLERYDYNVVIAENGEEAIEQITTVRPDLVLLDVIMPRKDGFEVLKAIKADPSFSNMPIVMLTSLAQASDEKTAREYGASDFLVKSAVSLNDILLRVQHLLEQAEAAVAQQTVTVTSSVPELGDSEAAVIAESIRAEAEYAHVESTVPDLAPQSTVPDLSQPIPVEVEANTDRQGK